MNLIYKKVDLIELEVLTKISRDTFIDAFEKDNNPEDFRRYIDEAFSPSQLESEVLNSNSDFYFVYLQGKLVGYFKLNVNEAQAEPFGKDTLEISRIYVLKQLHGQQLGTRILQQIIKMAKERHKSWIWLGVWQQNTHAVRFYERHGFTKFDTHSFYIGNDQQTDWLMKLDVV